MKYPEPKFTADQIAEVFADRWKYEYIARKAIARLQSDADVIAWLSGASQAASFTEFFMNGKASR